MIWTLRVYGDPKPKGSMKCVGGRGPIRHQLVEDDSTGDAQKWRDKVTSAATRLAKQIEPLDGHVIIGLLVVVPRPKAARTRLLPNRRSAGDVDKLLRMVLDALTDAGVLADDSRVTSTLAAKVYEREGLLPGALIYVAEAGAGIHATLLEDVLYRAPELEMAP